MGNAIKKQRPLYPPVRLTTQQQEAILGTFKDVFGSDAQLMLFGSRVDDQQSGGDIDLYIKGFHGTLDQQLQARLLFLVQLKQKIGDQRIDVVFAPAPGEPVQPIHQMAEKTGVLL